MTIAISGVTGFRNRGVAALVISMIQELEAVVDVPFAIFSGSPDFDQPRLPSSRARFFSEGDLLSDGTPSHRAERKRRFQFPWQSKGLTQFRKASLLIVTGGDIFSSEYGYDSLKRHLVPLSLAISENIPFVLLAQSIGPFLQKEQRDLWLKICRHAAHISVRERFTYQYLVENLRLDASKISRTSDPAFLLKPGSRGIQLGKTLRARNKRLIGVSVSEGLSEWSGISRSQRLATWVEVLSRLRRKLQAEIILIPHVQENYCDDRIICNDLLKALNLSPHVTVLDGDFSTGAYKGVLSQCSMVIAERMHAGIASMSSEVCTALVGYSVKARGILDEMVGPEFSQGCALIEGSDFDDPASVWNQVEMVWCNRACIESKLRKSVPKAKERARSALVELTRAVG